MEQDPSLWSVGHQQVILRSWFESGHAKTEIYSANRYQNTKNFNP